jgi:hypothetical protein
VPSSRGRTAEAGSAVAVAALTAISPVSGHRELQPADGGGNLRRLAEGATHLHRRARRAHGVALALEQEEERVPAELEQHPVALPGALDHGTEHAAQGLDQLLPARTAPLGESLSERREARDVRKAERPVDGPPEALRRVDRPFDRDLGDVSAETAHLSRA